MYESDVTATEPPNHRTRSRGTIGVRVPKKKFEVVRSGAIGLVVSLIACAALLLPQLGFQKLLDSSAVLVVGGTTLALFVSFPPIVLMSALRSVFSLFASESDSVHALLEEVKTCSKQIRRRGYSNAKSSDLLDAITNPDLKVALTFLTDGLPLPEITNILNCNIRILEESYEQHNSVFLAAAGYAPTMGILGSVLALSSSLRQMDDLASVGAGVSRAFLGTACGLAFSNFLFTPLSEKLSFCERRAVLRKRMVLAAVESIAGGLHPDHVMMKLEPFATALGAKPSAMNDKGDVSSGATGLSNAA